MISKIALFFSLFWTTVAGSCSNGVGGVFSCYLGMSDQETARLACESVYGSCSIGSCGKFKYYLGQGHKSCDCNKPVGQYEFIYFNGGNEYVGGSYGGTVDNVVGNGLFVRKKTLSSCGSTSWKLIRSLGTEATATPTENPTTPPTESPTSPTNLPTRIPCKDQFPWCVFPNVCDDVDFRLYCPFSCDDCRTAGPTSMPTAFPTEDCAAREDVLEGVIDHMLNHYLESKEDDESLESSK